jgi:hypothetical protein
LKPSTGCLPIWSGSLVRTVSTLNMQLYGARFLNRRLCTRQEYKHSKMLPPPSPPPMFLNTLSEAGPGQSDRRTIAGVHLNLSLRLNQ